MLFPKLPIAVMCLAVVTTCSKKAKNQTQGEYVAAVLSEDAVPVKPLLPTRPDGGVVEGKLQTLDPEEAERRRNRNMVEPIVFGTSVAGITMKTPYSQAMNTLVYYGSNNQGIDFFQEHIVIAWSAGSDPVPFQIGIQEGYGGKLKLPEPYGEVVIGQPMTNQIGTLQDLRSFMLTLGASFENKDRGTYDCEKSLTCQLSENESFFMLDFRLGGIYLGKTADLPIDFIYFTQPQQFFAPLVDPIIHNFSIGGVNFQASRSTVEARIGPPIARRLEGEGVIFSYYDKGNFAISWADENSAQSNPQAIKAVGAYGGTQAFGGAIGTRKLGDSFASYATIDATGQALLLAMDRILNKRTNPAYDCSVVNGEVAATCQAVIDKTVEPNRLLLVIDNSVYSFTHDDTRTWLSVGMRKP
jgi:hypothetical protein